MTPPGLAAEHPDEFALEPEPSPVEPPERASGGSPQADAEIAELRLLTRRLGALSPEARRRVLAYLVARFGSPA